MMSKHGMGVTAESTRGRDRVSRSNRRSVIATSAAAVAFGIVLLSMPCYVQTVAAAGAQASASAAPDVNAVRPFHINFLDEALVDLRQRIAATRWPDRETVKDQSQGVQLETMQKLPMRSMQPRGTGQGEAYPKLIHYNRLLKGGHFAAWEEPQVFATEIRASFRSLR